MAVHHSSDVLRYLTEFAKFYRLYLFLIDYYALTPAVRVMGSVHIGGAVESAAIVEIKDQVHLLIKNDPFNL